MDKNQSYGGGMSLLSVLQVIFIVLKLIGTINWSWWAVLIPTWIGIGLFVILIILVIIICLLD